METLPYVKTLKKKKILLLTPTITVFEIILYLRYRHLDPFPLENLVEFKVELL